MKVSPEPPPPNQVLAAVCSGIRISAPSERPEQRAGAAERGDDHHLHRDQNAEAGIRIDEAGLDRVERARDRGEGRGQRQRLQLGQPHRHAEALCGALARLDGAQIKAEAPPR